MRMGFAVTPSEQPTFRWKDDKTFSRQDASGRPFTWSDSAVTTETHPDVIVDCAVEFFPRNTTDGTSLGPVDSSRVILTLLDVDFEQVGGADLVLLGGTEYEIRYIEPPIGLFQVTVYRIHAQARDEA